MKKIILLTILFTASLLFSQNRINLQILNSNNIHLALQNIGKLGAIPVAFGGGVWKILSFDSTIVYDHGPWIIGKIDNKVHLSISQWGTNYSPGPIINNKAAMQYKPEDSLKYRIYKISKGDNTTNKDYAEWPFEFGAPKTKDGKPKLYQDQSLWCTYNAMFPSVKKQIPSFTDSLPIMPLEIHQLVYAKKGNSKDEVDLFSNTVFFEWTIINKGTLPIDSAYFSFWTDIDFDMATANFPAVDTTNNLGYMWSNKTKPQPAIGYPLLFGPAVPAYKKKAVFKGQLRNDFANLNVTSFQAIYDDYPYLAGVDRPSFSRTEAWNIVRGFYPSGKAKVDSSNNSVTKFSYSGDPVTNSGWLWGYGNSGGGAGFNLSSGPFNLAPNDTQWVMMALVPALGKDYKESITIMRNKVKLLKTLPYDSLAFGRKAVMVGVEKGKIIPTEISLEQNYPNPFNPETVISYSIPKSEHVTLMVYNLLGKEVATLVDEFKQAGNYKVRFNVETLHAASLSSGIYFYRLTTPTTIVAKKMMLVK